jgi:hypothetical protein
VAARAECSAVTLLSGNIPREGAGRTHNLMVDESVQPSRVPRTGCNETSGGSTQCSGHLWLFHCTLHCTALHCIALHYTALQCIALPVQTAL